VNFEQFKKIVESSHLNFLIGSGASQPFLKTLGNIEHLLDELNNAEIEEDKKIVIDASIKKYYYDASIKGNLQLREKDIENLEETKSSYKLFFEAINTILHKRKTNLITKQANVFTTNMDLFIDYTLEDSQLISNDGFSGRSNPKFGTENFHNTIRKTSTHYEYQSEMPLFNIFKLHGSVNWKLDEKGGITFDYGLSVLQKIEDLNLPASKFIDIVCPNCKREEPLEKLMNKYEDGFWVTMTEHTSFLECYNNLVMINPTHEKFSTTTKNLTFYELLRMYSNHLERENSVLFVIGFSFSDEHILEITKRVSMANPTLLIVVFAHSKEAKESILSLLSERNNVLIMCNENEQKFTLQTITNQYFKKLAEELTNPQKSLKKNQEETETDEQ
jgi:hypothetical protein